MKKYQMVQYVFWKRDDENYSFYDEVVNLSEVIEELNNDYSLNQNFIRGIMGEVRINNSYEEFEIFMDAFDDSGKIYLNSINDRTSMMKMYDFSSEDYVLIKLRVPNTAKETFREFAYFVPKHISYSSLPIYSVSLPDTNLLKTTQLALQYLDDVVGLLKL